MRILIVDDEPGILLAHARLLQDDGHTVVTATDYVQADVALRVPFDVVLSDMDLGGPSGLDVLVLAQRRSARALRAIMSGNVGDRFDAAVEAGIVHRVLQKPFGAAELRALVDEAASRPHSDIPTGRIGICRWCDLPVAEIVDPYSGRFDLYSDGGDFGCSESPDTDEEGTGSHELLGRDDA